jgi:peptide/nickel transport system ATP-binding protein
VIKAIDGISLTIEKGEILGLVGESGCGKSTLARTVVRLLSLTSGQILYKGKDIATLDKRELKQLRRNVQLIFQDSDSALDPRMNTRQILMEPLRIHDMEGGQSRQQIEDIMQKVRLSPAFLTRHPSELSGGQRQRLAIARALLLNPECIIGDEPLSGLDPVISMQLLDLMLSLKEDYGLTYVLISHDLNTVAYACDRIVVMYRGKIVELLNGEHFEAEAKHPYTRYLIGTDGLVSKGPIFDGVHSDAEDDHAGCVFCRRCPDCRALCAEEAPELGTISTGHSVACHNV